MQARWPVDFVGRGSEVNNVNYKPINSNGYYVGHKIRSWHNFVNTAAMCVIGLGVITFVVIIIAIATIMIWA